MTGRKVLWVPLQADKSDPGWYSYNGNDVHIRYKSEEKKLAAHGERVKALLEDVAGDCYIDGNTRDKARALLREREELER